MKVSMEHWWSDTERAKPKYSVKNSSRGTGLPQMSHELTCDLSIWDVWCTVHTPMCLGLSLYLTQQQQWWQWLWSMTLNECHPVVWHNKRIYKYLRQYTTILFNTILLLSRTWRHVSAAHTVIFRPAYNKIRPLMHAQYGIPHCLHIKYMRNKYI